MSIRVSLRLVLLALLGALMLVAISGALQFQETATLTRNVLEPNAQAVGGTANLARLLAEPDRGPGFAAAFTGDLARLEEIKLQGDGPALVAAVRNAFEAGVASQTATERDPTPPLPVIPPPVEGAMEGAFAGAAGSAHARRATKPWKYEMAIEAAVADLLEGLALEAERTVQDIHSEAVAASLGLGIVVALLLVSAVWTARMLRVNVFERLAVIDRASLAIQQGDTSRRVSLGGDDELAQIARTVDLVLDIRDQSEAGARGRHRELRAMLVALLRHWPHPAAITGIDGEIIASTLSATEEDILRGLTPQVRAAAQTLLSRGFVSALDLATEIRAGFGYTAQIRALGLSEQRVVGWFAVFRRPSGKEPPPPAASEVPPTPAGDVGVEPPPKHFTASADDVGVEPPPEGLAPDSG